MSNGLSPNLLSTSGLGGGAVSSFGEKNVSVPQAPCIFHLQNSKLCDKTNVREATRTRFYRLGEIPICSTCKHKIMPIPENWHDLLTSFLRQGDFPTQWEITAQSKIDERRNKQERRKNKQK